MSFKCPECGRISHNHRDEQERYCGTCRRFFGYPNLAFDSFADEAAHWGEISWMKVWWKRFRKMYMEARK
jgi:hypothetical protein